MKLMPKSFNSRPKRLSMTSWSNNNIIIRYALIMHDDHDIDQRFLKKKKIFRPTYPNFWGACNRKHTNFFIWPKQDVLDNLVHDDTRKERMTSSHVSNILLESVVVISSNVWVSTYKNICTIYEY